MNEKEKITAVAGLGRCGSSLAMQMFVAGGMEHLSMGPPLYDTLEAMGLPGDKAWLELAKGKAVKILRPDLFAPPRREDWLWIWLERDPEQQARSINKLHRAWGYPEVTANYLGQLSGIALHNVKTAGGRQLTLRFEEMLKSPRATAKQLVAFLGRPLDVPAMAAAVADRPAQCAPGLEFDPMWLRQVVFQQLVGGAYAQG